MKARCFIFLKFLIIASFPFFTLLNSNAKDQVKIDKTRSGGDLTVYNSSREAFAKPAPNLDVKELRKFTFGHKLFNTSWVTAPSSVKSLDGLGPLFNRNSCSACHTRDGRGRAVDPLEPASSQSALFRLSVKDKNGNVVPHPVYGDQLNNQAINGVLPEGQMVVKYEIIKGKFSDGETYELRKPIYSFKDLNYGDLGNDVMISPRVAPIMSGLGLIEAIDEKTILALADEQDKNNDGISGRPNYITDSKTKKKNIGKFGWKANQDTIRNQTAGAAFGDMGLTSSLHPKENCNQNQDDCKKQISGGNPELTNNQLDMMAFYIRTLAVPARRNIDDPKVIKGEEIFNKIGCAACHTPQLKTGKHELKELSNQIIYPYTDLLLHDMGEGLADNRPDILANGREWKTPPLWGIGLVKVVNKHEFFLHDGRARGLEEAILWHGGEASKAQNNYKNLSKEDRNNLIKFLESI